MKRVSSLVVAVAAVALAFTGCADSAPTASTAPGEAGTVSAVASNGRILITNRTDQPVFTMTVGRERLAHINLAPCIDFVRCPPIPPGGTRELSYPSDEIGPGEREAMVYSWHLYLHPADADWLESIRTIVVRL